ncbi:hypothetical protein BGT96224_2733 [Blumeria graminis f. sp. tritici 96224]|uniref:Uncharacterized protein n=1 Tax=Blumeria graminis f. sp. tritici 96224 TaxID=1268274 RepID=A0A656KKZ7_BLUGR|nr:hypothetical protein BGT96224_2733 [Blumeria graminis f. sp. tritici 96224]
MFRSLTLPRSTKLRTQISPFAIRRYAEEADKKIRGPVIGIDLHNRNYQLCCRNYGRPNR